MKRSDDSDKLGRRELLRRGALAGVAAGLLPFTGGRAARAEAQATVKRYVPLGRTGFEISDISFGSSRLDAGEENLVLDALEPSATPCGANGTRSSSPPRPTPAPPRRVTR